jgi:uncharacterized repeat protein (TIGR01451 family)
MYLIREKRIVRSLVAAALLACFPVNLWAGKISYTYDAADRLIAADYNTGRASTFLYDNNGNLLNRTTSMSTNADLGIDKVSDFSGVTVGFDLNFTLTVTNAGPDASTDVEVADTLPFSMLLSAFGASQGNASLSNRTIVGSLGTIPPGGNATVSISAFHTSTNETTNVATVAGGTFDPNPGNNIDSQVTRGLGPVFDSDGDGMANWWEERNGLNPFDNLGANGADGDFDFDGARNFDEWVADTRPDDASSFPRIGAINVQPGAVSLFFESSPIRLNLGQSSETLNPPDFMTFETVPGNGLPMSVTDTNSVSANRFYRFQYKLP